MKFYWLQCQNNQGKFHHFWAPGTKNKGEYVTKNMKWFTTEQSDLSFNTKISTRDPEKMCRTDKIWSKGVLDRQPDKTYSKI